MIMDKLYDEYYEKIYHWAIKKTNNKEDAEDLTNSVFLSIFEYFNRNIPVEKVENLIWKIAYNLWCTKVKDYRKERNNTTFNQDCQAGYQVEMIDKIIYKEIINNLDNIGLTNKERQSFEMYYMKDLSIKYISAKLGTKEPNIKYYLYSARKKIKEQYHE